jgi:hypothetical protein
MLKNYYINGGCQRFIHPKEMIMAGFCMIFLSGAGTAIVEEMETMVK